MGNRTKDAIILHSQQRNTDLLKLLLILGDGADDETGIVDPAPTRETLAELLGCTPRAITSRTQKLLESAELERIRMGSGKGRPSAFRITLPIGDTPMLSMKKARKPKAATTQRLAKLEDDVAQIFTLLQQLAEGQRVKLKGEDEPYEGGSEEGQRVKLKGEDEPYEGGSEKAQRVKGGSLKGEAGERVERTRSLYDPLLRSNNDPLQPPPPTPQSANDEAVVVALMEQMEIVNVKTRQTVSQTPAGQVLAWYWYGIMQTWADSPSSVSVKQMMDGNTPPPDLLTLANIWLDASLVDRAVMLQAATSFGYSRAGFYDPFTQHWLEAWEEALVSVDEITWDKLASNQKSLFKFQQLAQEHPHAFAWETEIPIDGYYGIPHAIATDV